MYSPYVYVQINRAQNSEKKTLYDTNPFGQNGFHAIWTLRHPYKTGIFQIQQKRLGGEIIPLKL